MPLDRHKSDPVPSPYDEAEDIVEPWADDPEPQSWWSRLWGWVYRRLG